MRVKDRGPDAAPGRSGGARAARIRRGSVLGLSGATLLPTLLGAVTGPLVARALAPAGRGQVAAVGAFSLALPVLLSLGMHVAIGQRAATEPGMRPRLVSAAVRFALLMVPPAILAAVAVMAGPLRSIRGTAGILAAVSLGMAPLGVLSFSLQQLLLAEGALGAYARVRAVPLVVSAALTIGLFLAGRLTVATYLLASLVAGMAGLVSACWFVKGGRGRAYPLRPLVGFGLRGFAGTIAGLTNARLDQMIMVPFLGSAQLGIYAVGVSIASLPLAAGQAISSRSFGEIASCGDQRAAAARYLRLTALVVGGACVAVAVAAPFLVPALFGTDFRGALAPLLILLPGTVASAMVVTSSSALQVLGRPGLPSWAELTGLAVTVAGLAILLRPFGIAAAALVSTLSYGATLLVNTAFLRRAGVRGLVPCGDDLRWVLGRIARVARSMTAGRTPHAESGPLPHGDGPAGRMEND